MKTEIQNGPNGSKIPQKDATTKLPKIFQPTKGSIAENVLKIALINAKVDRERRHSNAKTVNSALAKEVPFIDRLNAHLSKTTKKVTNKKSK